MVDQASSSRSSGSSQRLAPRFTYKRTPTALLPMPTLPERLTLPDPRLAEIFDVRLAADEATEAQAFSVRWEVYCRELGYEPAERFPDRRECDADDRRSVQVVVAHRASARPVGCFRLLLADPADIPRPFHVEQVCGARRLACIPTDGQARLGHAELSRFCIIAPFRHYDAAHEDPPWGIARAAWDAEVPLHRGIAGMMWLAAAHIAVRIRLDFLLTLMEPRLQVLGKVMGLNFQSIGDPVEFRGIRVPYRIDRRSLRALLALPQTAALLRPLQDSIARGIDRHPLLSSYMDSGTARIAR